MSDRYDVDKVLENPFIDNQAREFFETYGSVIEQQADLIAERRGLDDKEQEAHLDEYLQDLEEKKYEYIVQGALLTCSKGTCKKQIVMYKGEELESTPSKIQACDRIQVPNTRSAHVYGNIPATVMDCKGGMRDASNDEINIFGFGNCGEIANKAVLEDLLEKAGLTGKEEDIKKAIEEGKGTCHCFMNLNDNWENLSMVGEYLTDEFFMPCGGVQRAFWNPPSPPYLQFDGKEGINMMSMLFCQYGGGIITAQESGQAYVSLETDMALDILKEYLRDGTIEEEQAEWALDLLAFQSNIDVQQYKSALGRDYNRYDTYIIGWTEYYRMEMGVSINPSYIKSQMYQETEMGYTTHNSKIPVANVSRDLMQALDVRNGNIYDYIGISTDQFYAMTSSGTYQTGMEIWTLNYHGRIAPPTAEKYNEDKWKRCSGIVARLFNTEKDGTGDSYTETDNVGTDKKTYYLLLDEVTPIMSIGISLDKMQELLTKYNGDYIKAFEDYNANTEIKEKYATEIVNRVIATEIFYGY